MEGHLQLIREQIPSRHQYPHHNDKHQQCPFHNLFPMPSSNSFIRSNDHLPAPHLKPFLFCFQACHKVSARPFLRLLFPFPHTCTPARTSLTCLLPNRNRIALFSRYMKSPSCHSLYIFTIYMIYAFDKIQILSVS